MTIRVWRAYSCNNSSSYRLVARFSEPFQAEETAIELREFLLAHARQVDEADVEIFDGGNTRVADALAAKYGFAWEQLLMWGGGESLVDDEPEVVAMGDVLVIYHGYCSGFDPGLQHYLKARGAASIDESMAPPVLSVLFDFNGSSALAKDLDMLIAQSGKTGNTPLRTPWEGTELYADCVFFRDAGTVGLFFEIRPSDLRSFRDWLSGHDVLGASLQLCNESDEALFKAVAKARCAACDGPLTYLDPRIHDIETPQLMCKPCGGLYDLQPFLETR